MAGAPIKQPPKTFDDAKLQAMTEPLTVRVERLKNNTRSPIPLPDNADGSPGSTGWSKEEIQRIDAWIVSELPGGGGGLFEVSVTDSSQPTPIVMKWQPYFNPMDYPERPLALEGTAAQFTPPTQVNQPQQVNQVRQPNQFMNYTFQPQQAPSFGGYPMPAPPPIGTPGYMMWQGEAEKRERDAELKRLRDENDRREREALEAKHKAEMERERTSVNDRFGRLEGLISNLATSLKEAATPKGESPELIAMKAQMQAMQEQTRIAQEQARIAQERADNDRRERETRELITRMQDQMNQQIQATNQRMETLISQLTASSNKHDPIISLMQEQARQHTESLREITRSTNDVFSRMQGMIMQPRELLALAQDGQRSIDTVTERVTKFFGNVVDMQQRVMDNALSMQPSGNPVIEAITHGLDNLKDLGKRYVGAKEIEQKVAAQANVEVARAQAAAIEAQARATNPAAFVGVPVPPPVAQDQLNGMAGMEEAPAAKAPPRIERLWGRTDEEWFGPMILSNVHELREGVKTFHESLAADPMNVDKNGQPLGTSPEAAANGILMGAQMAQQHGLVVPAYVELFARGQVAEFVGVLLPNPYSSEEFRADVVGLLKKAIEGAGADNADDDDDDDDDDDEEQAAPISNGVAPKAPTAPQPQPRGRQRARA